MGSAVSGRTPEVRPRSPILRLLATRGRVVRSRASVVVAATLPRRRRQVYTLWPDASAVMLSADVGYPPAAEWLRTTIVPTLRRLPDAATWMVLRAGAAILAEAPGLAARAAQQALPAGATPRVAMYSPSGHAVSKALCFVFVDGEIEPRVVVKAIADPRFSNRLQREADLLRVIAERVSTESTVASALPSSPILTADVAGEFMTVESVDPLAPATATAERNTSLRWLRSFQHASSTGASTWRRSEASAAVATVRTAWQLAAPASADAMTKYASTLLGRLVGSELPRCAIHGDFWRGNIAAANGRLRVYDWEWAEPDGIPLFDLWTYELAELRVRAASEEQGLERALLAALIAVEQELRLRGLDPTWARATLAPVLAELTFRIRNRLGIPSSMEGPSTLVMAAAERLLGV